MTNIQPWHTPFPIWNQPVVPCPVLTVASWPTYRFLRRQVRWSGLLSLKNFPQFVVIHMVKGFSKQKHHANSPTHPGSPSLQPHRPLLRPQRWPNLLLWEEPSLPVSPSLINGLLIKSSLLCAGISRNADTGAVLPVKPMNNKCDCLMHAFKTNF